MLPRGVIGSIHALIDAVFDRAKFRFLGTPVQNKEIRIGIKVPEQRQDLTLQATFDAASRSEGLSPDDKIRDSLTSIAASYIDAHRESAKARVVEAVNSFLINAQKAGVKTDVETVLGGELETLMGKVKSDLQTIVESETSKARNVGGAASVSKVAASLGISDPTVCFIGPNDNITCSRCKLYYFLEDGLTPKVYKMSELSSGYVKKGDKFPSVIPCHPRCLVGSSRLHTNFGMLTVKELFDMQTPLVIPVDKRVRIKKDESLGIWIDRHQPEGVVLRDSSPVFYTGEQECVSIELENGASIEVSENHEFWVDNDASGLRKEAKDLIVGEKLMLLSGEGLWGADHFPEEAELIGNLLGDGNINRQTSVACWQFFGDDIPYGNHIFELSKNLRYRIGYSNKGLASEMQIKPPDRLYAVEHCEFNSGFLGRYFVENFGVQKYPEIKVPNRIFGATKDTVAAFLRGLFAADGTSYGLTVALSQKDRSFLVDIQRLLSNFGIRASLLLHEVANDDRKIGERVIHSKTHWRIVIGSRVQCERFLSLIGFGVPAKNEKLARALASSSGKKCHGPWKTSRIASIKKIGVHPTYCVTEPMSNTITVNGIVTGNCRHTLAQMLPGFGFRAGKITWISRDHDEYRHQRGS